MSDKKEITEISFYRKPAKSGRTYLFVIPKPYIDNGLIDLNHTFDQLDQKIVLILMQFLNMLKMMVMIQFLAIAF
jgi:hypothetical protein